MVKGRTPRESNPLPGEKPGFVASHDTTGEEDYKRTSPLNPLPVTSIGDSNVKDTPVKTELESINAKLNGKTEITNLPETQKVEITNHKESQEVIVGNQPTDYPNAAVKTELEAIKSVQNDILAKLNSGIDTQVTGSNVEDGLPVKNVINDYEVVFEREIRTSSSVYYLNVPNGARGLIYELKVFSTVGEFNTNEGIEQRIHPRSMIDGGDLTLSMTSERKQDAGFSFFGLWYKGAEEVISGSRSVFDIIHPFELYTNNIRIDVGISGTFAEGEGIDCSGSVLWIF